MCELVLADLERGRLTRGRQRLGNDYLIRLFGSYGGRACLRKPGCEGAAWPEDWLAPGKLGTEPGAGSRGASAAAERPADGRGLGFMALTLKV